MQAATLTTSTGRHYSLDDRDVHQCNCRHVDMVGCSIDMAANGTQTSRGDACHEDIGGGFPHTGGGWGLLGALVFVGSARSLWMRIGGGEARRGKRSCGGGPARGMQSFRCSGDRRRKTRRRRSRRWAWWILWLLAPTMMGGTLCAAVFDTLGSSSSPPHAAPPGRLAGSSSYRPHQRRGHDRCPFRRHHHQRGHHHDYTHHDCHQPLPYSMAVGAQLERGSSSRRHGSVARGGPWTSGTLRCLGVGLGDGGLGLSSSSAWEAVGV